MCDTYQTYNMIKMIIMLNTRNMKYTAAPCLWPPLLHTNGIGVPILRFHDRIIPCWFTCRSRFDEKVQVWVGLRSIV